MALKKKGIYQKVLENCSFYGVYKYRYLNIYIYLYMLLYMGIPKIKYRKTFKNSKTLVLFVFLTQVPALRSEVPMDEIHKKQSL